MFSTTAFKNNGLSRAFLLALSLTLAVGCASNPGDSRAKTGAKSGAAVGAGVGLLLGILSGDSRVAVAATAIGAGVGAAQGGYEGWRQDQDDDRTRQITDAINKTNSQQAIMDAESRTREELTRFLGVWSMKGWVEAPGESRANVSAQVNGNIHMNYFVEMAYIDLKVDGYGDQIWGTSTLGYDAKSGFSISSRFNVLDEAITAENGTFNSNNRSFSFSDGNTTSTASFQTPDRFVFTTSVYSNGKKQTVESYEFTRQ